MSARFVLVLGGDPPSPALLREAMAGVGVEGVDPADDVCGTRSIGMNAVPSDDGGEGRPVGSRPVRLIGADAGTRAILAAGLTPDAAIGDWDSAPELVDRLQAMGVSCVRLNPEKDETDGEAALALAARMGAGAVVLLGAFGGRMDQSLGSFAILLRATRMGLEAEIWQAGERGYVCVSAREMTGRAGRRVSLVPLGGDARIGRTWGLKWPLRDHLLRSDSTLGISNEMTGERAGVSVTQGVVLVVIEYP